MPSEVTTGRAYRPSAVANAPKKYGERQQGGPGGRPPYDSENEPPTARRVQWLYFHCGLRIRQIQGCFAISRRTVGLLLFTPLPEEIPDTGD